MSSMAIWHPLLLGSQRYPESTAEGEHSGGGDHNHIGAQQE